MRSSFFGDPELPAACARDLLKLAPEYDYLMTNFNLLDKEFLYFTGVGVEFEGRTATERFIRKYCFNW